MTAMLTGYASLSKENIGSFIGVFRKSFKGDSLEIVLTFIPAHSCSIFRFVGRSFFFSRCIF